MARLLPWLTALLTLTAMWRTDTAWAWSPGYEGQPSQLHAGADAGYYIWHDDAGNHLATTGPGPEHHFEASVSSDGRLFRVEGSDLEGQDAVHVADGGHMLRIDFTTHDRIDQVDFRDEGGSDLEFDLMMDGQRIDLHDVWIGGEGLHPLDGRFRVYR